MPMMLEDHDVGARIVGSQMGVVWDVWGLIALGWCVGPPMMCGAPMMRGAPALRFQMCVYMRVYACVCVCICVCGGP